MCFLGLRVKGLEAVSHVTSNYAAPVRRFVLESKKTKVATSVIIVLSFLLCELLERSTSAFSYK